MCVLYQSVQYRNYETSDRAWIGVSGNFLVELRVIRCACCGLIIKSIVDGIASFSVSGFATCLIPVPVLLD
jgi:hypothetical protein